MIYKEKLCQKLSEREEQIKCQTTTEKHIRIRKRKRVKRLLLLMSWALKLSDHISEAWSESTGGLQIFSNWNHDMMLPEAAVIASDIAVKSGNVYLGFADRFHRAPIITGEISDVMSASTGGGLLPGFTGM